MSDDILFSAITRGRFGGGDFSPCGSGKNDWMRAGYAIDFPTLWNRFGSFECGLGRGFRFQYINIGGYESGESSAQNEQEVLDILRKNSAAGNQLAAQLAAQSQLAAEAAQLQAQTAILQSNTAQWSNQQAYTAQVANTSAEIRAYNADVAAFLATAPAGDVAKAQQAGVSIQNKPTAQTAPSVPGTAGEKKDNTGIIIAGVAIAVVVGAILLGGRK